MWINLGVAALAAVVTAMMPVNQALSASSQESPSPELIKSLVLLGDDCLGSVISPQALLLTSARCVESCLQQHQADDQNIDQTGFVAAQHQDELLCPHLPAWRFEQAHTDQNTCIKSSEPGDLCLTSDQTTDRFSRLRDVRLVFAPAKAARQFGGKLEAGQFPRHALDVALLRLWSNNQPSSASHHLRLGSRPERHSTLRVLQVKGPARTPLSAAQLRFLRDHELPARFEYGRLALQHLPPQGKPFRQRQKAQMGIAARLEALRDPEFFAQLLQPDWELQQAIASKKKWRKRYGHISAGLDAIKLQKSELIWPSIYLGDNDDFWSDRYRMARLLVEGLNSERVPAVAYTQDLLKLLPSSEDQDIARLAQALSAMRDSLGHRHPIILRLFAEQEPLPLARQMLENTVLDRAEKRLAIWHQGAAAAAAHPDPLLRFAHAVASEKARVMAKLSELQAAEAGLLVDWAQAHQAALGTSPTANTVQTEALFSFAAAQPAASPTRIGDLYQHATAREPLLLPAHWWPPQDAIPSDSPLNISLSSHLFQLRAGAPILGDDETLQAVAFELQRPAARNEYHWARMRPSINAVHLGALRPLLSQVHPAEHLLEELKGLD